MINSASSAILPLKIQERPELMAFCRFLSQAKVVKVCRVGLGVSNQSKNLLNRKINIVFQIMQILLLYDKIMRFQNTPDKK